MGRPARSSLSRRALVTAVTAGAASAATAAIGCEPRGPARSAPRPSRTTGAPTMRTMPSIYLAHGGGPWPWTAPFTPQLGVDYRSLRAYLEGLSDTLPERPTGIVIVSAHWEQPVPTVLTSARPRLEYDYDGFPEETYRLEWSAPGSPTLAAEVRRRLEDANIPTAQERSRGFDHGTFVPMKLAFPQADVRTVQLSLDAGYDPAKHLAIGRALAPLRAQGVLIVGSGMSWEDFRARDIVRRSREFDAWFQRAATASPRERDEALLRWTEAPHARVAHPHEEHLLPMMVAAGAAGEDRGRIAWSGSLMGIRVSAVHFEPA